MKFSLPWLKEHLATTPSADEIAEKLTSLGLEVEGVDDRATRLGAFTVAHVVDAVAHPNADRLRLCTVSTIDGEKQIVCGAPNARTGLIGIYAPVGSTIPANGMVLKPSKIRGVESQGMLCSARELGIGDEHDGIIELARSLDVGMPAIAALGIETPVFDVAVTPDRADCFGVNGIARDLAAAGLGELTYRDFSPVPGTGTDGMRVSLEFPKGEEQACPLFVGRLFRGVKNGPSPAWLQQRLRSIGLRPISALVDITNYVTYDLNRPLHVFDAGKLQGNLTLRFARAGEDLLALDGKSYELHDGVTVIADEAGPQALGGVMGGEPSGCDEQTTEVLLEVALFDPIRTAMTGRSLGIESDARTRFERGVDPAMVLPGMEYATQLILELCGGEAAPPIIAGAVPTHEHTIEFPLSELTRLGGITLEQAEVERHLKALGFGIDGSPEMYRLRAPSWRRDVTTAACIVEELCRLHGYDQIPPVPVARTGAVGQAILTGEQQRRQRVRRAIAAEGFAEAVTWSFADQKLAGLFGGDDLARLSNPINSELAVMRPSLLPNLLTAAAENVANRRENGALFELGPRFTGRKSGDQVVAIAGVRFGSAVERHWAEKSRLFDVFDAKSDAIAALAAHGIRTAALQICGEAPSWYHPGRSGGLALGPNILAWFGELHPDILEAVDLPRRAVAFEIDIDPLPKPKAKAGRARPSLEVWPYPPVVRDFAFVVDVSVAGDRLIRAVRGADKKLIRDVTIFDVYQGQGVEDGKKSVALAVHLQSMDRTLVDEEIEPIAQRIIAAAEKQVGAALRA